MTGKNLDFATVRDFGEEWSIYDQSVLPAQDSDEIFEEYFQIFPWHVLPPNAEGFDLGCGSGRWARLVAPRIGILHCIDANEDALNVARRNLAGNTRCRFHVASVDHIPLDDNSMDFGYSLGVLHHVPDTPAGIQSCVAKLKPGAPLLLYLYYAFDDRPRWFVMLWKVSDYLRRFICRLPTRIKVALTSLIAASVYFPAARLALILERLGLDVSALPLCYYRRRSFYTMRTDALDRFGTRLEQRFTAAEIRRMMEDAGLESVVFSQANPYWCAVGIKRNDRG